LSTLSEQIDALRASLSEREVQIERLSAELDRVSSERDRASSELDHAASELAGARAAAERAGASIHTLRASNLDLADRLAGKEHELGRSPEELELFATAQAAARIELESLRRDSRVLAALIAGGRIGTPPQQSRSQLRSWVTHGRFGLVRSYRKTQKAGD